MLFLKFFGVEHEDRDWSRWSGNCFALFAASCSFGS
jgi:hypothetical protein